VQEILAEREYRIGRFYFLRQSWAAAIARLKTLTDTYPLYSQADDALFMLGQANERELERLRPLQTGPKFTEQTKAKLLKVYTDAANDAYSKILTRYPMMPRAEDAKARLQALDLAVPTPTEAAIEQNKKEIASRGELGRMGRMMLTFHKRPDFSAAAKVGDPTLVDPPETSAPALIREANEIVTGTKSGDNKVSVETAGTEGGKIPESQPIPRSDSDGQPVNKSDVPKQMPEQVNEASGTSSPTKSDGATTQTTTSPDTAKSSDTKKDDSKDDKTVSSSKPKKKKGLKKLIPF
jgi:outer membrane protein assembly factor BamD